MRNYLLSLCFGVLLCSGLSPSFGQDIAYLYAQPQKGKPAQTQSLKEALAELEPKYNVSFIYKDKLSKINVNSPAEQEVSSLEKVLNSLLEPKGLVFEKVRKNFYIIRSKSELSAKKLKKIKASLKEETSKQPTENPKRLKRLDNVNLRIQQEQKVITGTVKDENGAALPGVNIMIKGSSQGTISDIDGKYKIQVGNKDVLVFSFIGYASQEVEVGSQKEISVTLLSDVKQLSEVLVVAYNTQSKASFTGSAVAIQNDKLEKAPRASFQESLQGNVAGVQSMSGSGQPGANPNVRIRGIGSITASSTPLYVVDGIPVVNGDISRIANSANTIAGINNNDIESVSILKDAAATSIYGSRGANGVILITTKSGKAGKTKFNANAQYGFSKITMADRNRPLNTAEMTELLIEGRVNAGKSPEDARDFILARVDTSVSTDWFDEITRTGKYQQYNLSASGGNEKTNFYTSLGYYEQEATIIGVDYQKLNAKVNLRHQASKKLNFNMGLAFNQQLLHTVSDEGSFANPVRAMYRLAPWNPVYNEDGSFNTGMNSTYNPVGIVAKNTKESKLYNALGNIGGRYEFADFLSFESKASLDFNFADEFQFDNPEFGAGRNDNGRGYAYTTKYVNWNVTNLLKFSHSIQGVHGINVTLGQEAQRIDKSTSNAYAINFIPNLETLDNASEYKDAASSKTASAIASYFVNAGYNFREKYYINGTFRRDGSSRFGRDVRYANFWSVGLAWNLHKENFLKPLDWINELKLRSSYGINGNQGIGNFASRGLYGTGNNYNGQPGFAYTQRENIGLTWEKNKSFNLGMDVGLWQRITASVEYYHRTTSDLLLDVPVSSTNGVTNYVDNVGEMVNKGWEITLNTENIKSQTPGGFNWNTSFNFTQNKNEITALQGDDPIIENGFIRKVGGDFYQHYRVGYAGVDPQTGDALWYTDGTKTETTNKYSEAERFEQGSALPKFYGGMTNTLSYKGFTLSVQLNYNWGNKVYDIWGIYTHSDGSRTLSSTGNMSRQIYERRWQKPGDITDIPKVVYSNKQSGRSSQSSTRFLYDGSFIRLRDITLSYQIPKNVINSLRLSDARVYVRGNNLFTYVKDDKLDRDPETTIAGQFDQLIPIAKQILFGIDLSF
ncbi:TonB-dependent receptor [Rapidithrix thailandica]|uniref:TonB-dependent receptor n=1 Tax=Rapidithrix thailandica TaxID=413964 RepID=A0AAW9SFZ8_9BACT